MEAENEGWRFLTDVKNRLQDIFPADQSFITDNYKQQKPKNAGTFNRMSNSGGSNVTDSAEPESDTGYSADDSDLVISEPDLADYDLFPAPYNRVDSSFDRSKILEEQERSKIYYHVDDQDNVIHSLRAQSVWRKRGYHSDEYLDTKDHRLARAGKILRRRTAISPIDVGEVFTKKGMIDYKFEDDGRFTLFAPGGQRWGDDTMIPILEQEGVRVDMNTLM